MFRIGICPIGILGCFVFCLVVVQRYVVSRPCLVLSFGWTLGEIRNGGGGDWEGNWEVDERFLRFRS